MKVIEDFHRVEGTGKVDPSHRVRKSHTGQNRMTSSRKFGKTNPGTFKVLQIILTRELW